MTYLTVLIVLMATFYDRVASFRTVSRPFLTEKLQATNAGPVNPFSALYASNTMEWSPKSICRNYPVHKKGLSLAKKWSLGLFTFFLAFVHKTKSVFAKMKGNSLTARGWDLYGRVPNDDFLFTTGKLADPNLLRRSFVETVVDELPDMLGNFRRRKRINEVTSILSGLGYFAGGMLVIGILYKSAMNANALRSKRDDATAGWSASAISKKGPRQGRTIEGMGEGWIDMEDNEDDDAPNDDPPKGKKK